LRFRKGAFVPGVAVRPAVPLLGLLDRWTPWTPTPREGTKGKETRFFGWFIEGF